MNDKKLKDMWNQAEQFMGNINYHSTTIEGFISSSSNSITAKIMKMLKRDIITKIVIAFLLIIDIFLFYNVQSFIAYTCGIGLFLLLILLWYENNILKQFTEIADNRQSAKEKIENMHSFLQNRSFATLLSMASTYLFGFNAGILLYFFAEYGQLRRMGSIDYLVFPTICLLGILFNYVYNNKIIKFQTKHLELCLSDMNEDVLPIVSSKIDKQEKSERTISILVMIIVFLSFLLLVAVLKRLGL